MRKPIRIKIDVTKLDKERFFRAKSGAVYCDLVAWPNDKVSEYGDTHRIMQSKRQGEDVKLPIVGNLTMPEDERPAPAKQTPPRTPQSAPKPPADPDLDAQPDDVPF